MDDNLNIHGRTLQEWKKAYPLLSSLIATEEAFWLNEHYESFRQGAGLPLREEDIRDAEARLVRFAPYLQSAFPETRKTDGLIESPLLPIPEMQSYLESVQQIAIPGKMWLKCDSHLPIAGSIKARGGIYEVLKHAEDLALTHRLLTPGDDYAKFSTDAFRELFSRHSIAVGSTGNLGLSIGIISAQLGFQVTVHMSADAKEWKKELLRSKGVNVAEHASDYSKAVEEGRKQAAADPSCYFIDDENSKDLFFGYAVAAYRLKNQLDALQITVDREHPLFVYLPCGVGGGPGGVAFGLKQVFGDHVHCFFAEPTHSPCMLLGLMTGLHDQISVQDFGIDNKTEADGLAVGRPSRFVGRTIETLLSGIYTVEDDELLVLLAALRDQQGIRMEPSALAGMCGPSRLAGSAEGRRYIEKQNLSMKQATHIVWGTGGSLVPESVQEEYYQRGLQMARSRQE
ncbi:D-serine ammonia-lyase [Brevibacillus panacihumi]|uniref:Probable D-serine dehydratase n=1 Tax=Brevibacillus panacihumi TaxID=497735 RepID=A0A3M8CMZ8_9BACL|nr:D-serine ammonia-lyase [Brevibacillus panacihumi]RNB76255.1 D-serine ammonia-lyase [Brevibacillus panacihumi]